MHVHDVARRARMVYRAFGVKGLARRATYLAQVKSGRMTAATPQQRDYSSFASRSWSHRFDLDAVRDAYASRDLPADLTNDVVDECRRLLSGSLRFYGGTARQTGWPPRWHTFPNGDTGPALAHWSQISDDLPGDIKDLWEPSRFGFTFLLARAFVLTGDETWADAWWSCLEDWMAANPPNTGVNWRCGQETSLRGMAVCFGVSTFRDLACSTPHRIEMAGRLLEASARRVRPSVAYALSQRNNHAISELVFLLSLAQQPDQRLERLLRDALSDQFYADGSYSQQSLNYERLALHALTWLMHSQPRLELSTRREILRCLSLGGHFLARCSAPNGRLHNSGANDGALLFDLDQTPRWDTRPTLEMLDSMLAPRCESSCWFPPSKLAVPRVTASIDTVFHTMAGPRSSMLTHLGDSRHRPGDDDQQSIELIIDDDPVLLDPGSYRYSGSGAWRQPFTNAHVHNAGVAVDHTSTAASIGRFLREAQTPARVLHRVRRLDLEVLVSEVADNGRQRMRAIARMDDTYLIVDRSIGGPASYRFLLASDGTIDLGCRTYRTNNSLVRWHAVRTPEFPDRTPDDPASGWWSPLYSEREPAQAMRFELSDGDWFVLTCSPADCVTPLDALVQRLQETPEVAGWFAPSASMMEEPAR